MGFFDKIKQGLKKTVSLLNTDVRDIFKGHGRLVDDAFLEEWTEILIKTDMGVAAAQEIIDDLKSKYRARVVEMDDILAIVRAKPGQPGTMVLHVEADALAKTTVNLRSE